ncbi:PEPxxWA-CTERM sorting domain-containing protein [Bradyrhizobium sp. GCM10023182]|uniref:PEPxxWA-CTERM sorting domain-containing protein n=1 Tax=Bradyrhizobium zhengyangense TaxID=2911009 RepID=A0ABS9M1Z6_9BRAD|nr:PEPxxWA-CTERM sorting domain-containing protein [Bradyrhizobium zhengyangense]MCG2673285.1 PEPxxWA-CTERM sorting domain-containing protein [Bradyrhizobium zhengyangense]
MLLKKLTLAVVLSVSSLLSAVSANASVFDFTYSDSANDIFGHGTFTTSDVASPFTITGISGTETYLGLTETILGLSSYASANNLLFIPAPFVDFSGIAFTTASNQFGIGWTGSNYGIVDFNSNPSGGCCGTEVTFNVTAVPEPSTWAMMISGFICVGYLAMRRRQSQRIAL